MTRAPLNLNKQERVHSNAFLEDRSESELDCHSPSSQENGKANACETASDFTMTPEAARSVKEFF